MASILVSTEPSRDHMANNNVICNNVIIMNNYSIHKILYYSYSYESSFGSSLAKVVRLGAENNCYLFHYNIISHYHIYNYV